MSAWKCIRPGHWKSGTLHAVEFFRGSILHQWGLFDGGSDSDPLAGSDLDVYAQTLGELKREANLIQSLRQGA